MVGILTFLNASWSAVNLKSITKAASHRILSGTAGRAPSITQGFSRQGSPHKYGARLPAGSIFLISMSAYRRFELVTWRGFGRHDVRVDAIFVLAENSGGAQVSLQSSED